MRLTFIGTSHGLPEPNRKCSCTLITVGQNNYFVDMGAQAMENLINMGIEPNSVKGIFFTHKHGDHTDGIINFYDLATWYYRECNPVIQFSSPEFINAINVWREACGESPREGITLETVKNGLTFDDGILKVTAVPTEHTSDSHAFLIEAEGKKVLFTGDLAYPEKDFPAIAYDNELECIIGEGAHFSILQYLPYLEKCKYKRFFLNHYPAFKNMDNLKTFRDTIAPIPFKLATDGLIVEI